MNTYLYNRNTGKTYQVMGLADGVITLKNELAEFCDTYDRDKFKRQGYMKVDAVDEETAVAKAKAQIAAHSAAEIAAEEPAAAEADADE